MKAKIQLKHPEGKKAVMMASARYTSLKKALLNHLKKNGESTFEGMCQAVTEYFKKSKIKFEGSIPWHVEWIKLDLEANRIIARIPKTSPQKYILIK